MFVVRGGAWVAPGWVSMEADSSRWDASSGSPHQPKDDDDTSGVKAGEASEEDLFRIQAHARNSITAMKIDPIEGNGVS